MPRTFQISDPAPLIPDCRPERHRRVRWIWLVGPVHGSATFRVQGQERLVHRCRVQILPRLWSSCRVRTLCACIGDSSGCVDLDLRPKRPRRLGSGYMWRHCSKTLLLPMATKHTCHQRSIECNASQSPVSHRPSPTAMFRRFWREERWTRLMMAMRSS